MFENITRQIRGSHYKARLTKNGTNARNELKYGQT